MTTRVSDIFRKSGYFIVVIIAILLICAGTHVSAENSSGSFNTTGSFGLLWGPVVTGTSHNTTIIRFLADPSCTSTIRYANDSSFLVEGTYDHQVRGTLNGTSHAILLSDLDPATRYHYSVDACGFDGRDRTFVTMPAHGSCTFIVYGDTREQAPLYTQVERHKLVAERIAEEPDIQFVINSGDLVADSNDRSEWIRFLNSTERLRSVTTYRAVPGNHDSDRSLFRELFGKEGRDYFDCGAARIVLLDSTDVSLMTMREQAQWLSKIQKVGGRITIAILHHPVYSSEEKHYGGFEDLQEILVPALKVSGVHLVFNSHVHAFEQVKRNSITFITEGRGGAPAYPLNTTRIPGSVKTVENTLGYSRVSIDPDAGEIRIEVIRVADVSPDLQTVTKVYPLDTVDTKIRIPIRSTFGGFTDISELLCFHRESEGISRCWNPLIPLNKLPI